MKVYEDRRLEVHPSAPADRSPLVVHGSEKAYNYMNINSGSLVAIIAVNKLFGRKQALRGCPTVYHDYTDLPGPYHYHTTIMPLQQSLTQRPPYTTTTPWANSTLSDATFSTMVLSNDDPQCPSQQF
eukprot:CAMPEP_0174346716 /NCGR_PEP_ID=MMETSP0811_2-20130205/2504_1 /TAXON_ID=73025 ORGANISM="Eutreptiella gymnastica-like, Strain CCMP1594" /NCGR_SAMPLE_ID=MMETSP0811_2 /ASSEMBLY_ACC=CAM_ASM_000667 /LENGTH=126 /DNA_ID=CAMNT_0015471533 /DNA_START=894 /DNA_END=1275 /DNA_ORIENTATION=-